MKKLLINVDYRDNAGKFWCESYIKNQTAMFDETKESIHNFIAKLCYDTDYMKLTYNNKPQSNMYIDSKNGDPKIVGYVYRGKTEIHDRSMPKAQTGYFDVWVTIQEINKFEFETI